jgi:hypothetical protein
VACVQSRPLAYWRLNDPAQSVAVRNYGCTGSASDAKVVRAESRAARAVRAPAVTLGHPCGIVNDSSRFEHSTCVRAEEGAQTSFVVSSRATRALVPVHRYTGFSVEAWMCWEGGETPGVAVSCGRFELGVGLRRRWEFTLYLHFPGKPIVGS